MVSRAVALHETIEEVIVHTGQHYDQNMSKTFFQQMSIPDPRYYLGIHSMNHGAMTGKMLEGIEEVLTAERPDLVMVYGDTNSTLAGALAARKLNIKLVHVEAGLRSFNMSMPEEINRILTDRISDILCCPTLQAAENLRKEGYDHFPAKVSVTGDVMQDAAFFHRKLAEERSDILAKLHLVGKPFALCTIHRAENTDEVSRLKTIVWALSDLSKEIAIVFPVHPRTREAMLKNGLTIDCMLVEPLGYLDMVSLLTNCRIVLTDSGGLQKEAFFFAKPCVTVRDQTEWVELVDGGFNVLAGADRQRIKQAFERMLIADLDFGKDLYGQGMAASRIVSLILQVD